MTVSVEFCTELNKTTRDWYHTAERKAALLFTLDGVFITALTATMLAKPGDIKQIINAANPVFWLIIAFLMVSILYSVWCAVDCVRSRVYSDEEIEKLFSDGAVTMRDGSSIWYFQLLARYEPSDLVDYLSNGDQALEINALTANLPHFAGNVVEKHRAVNRGFLAAGVALASLLFAAASYVAGFVW